jgi:hypothetical protein
MPPTQYNVTYKIRDKGKLITWYWSTKMIVARNIKEAKQQAIKEWRESGYEVATTECMWSQCELDTKAKK